MIFVILYFLLFLLVDYFCLNNRNNHVNVQCIFCFLLLFIFFGFRNLPVLNDTAHYYGHFYRLMQYTTFKDNSIFYFDQHERFEYGYMVLLRFLGKYISNNPYSIIIFSSLLISVVNVWFVKRYTNRVALTVFFMFGSLLGEYAAIRQGFSCLFFFIGFQLLLSGKTKMYYLMIFLAYMFHHSAVILFFIPLLRNIKLKKKHLHIVLSLAILLSIGIKGVLKILGYSGSIYYNTIRETTPWASIINMIIVAIILGLCYYMYDKMKLTLPDNLLIWVAIIGLCFTMQSIFFLAFTRFSLYFFPFVILLFVNILYINSNTIEMDFNLQRKINYLQILLVFLFLFRFVVILIFKNEWNHLIPYSFFDFRDGYHPFMFGY